MTSTARRRWSRELEIEIDGIAFGTEGPVLVHGYDPPAGGMWVDSVIPGKLGALDRHTGETLWLSPCEVGYGRGFAAGFGSPEEVIVLGPSEQGQRIVRMERETGKLLGVEAIGDFDEAMVFEDLCLCANAKRVFAISTPLMSVAWAYEPPKERIHHIARCGDRVLVGYSRPETGAYGVLALDALTGEPEASLVPCLLPGIHGLAGGGDEAVILTADLQAALPPELAGRFLVTLGEWEQDGEVVADTLSLLGLAASATDGQAGAWFEILSTTPVESVPEISITSDSGKLYVVRGAMLEVRDILTGRALGSWAIPGLDEQVAWQVSSGAGLLAEEQRVSVFELPA
ncbi:MAG: hypothetical protein QF903_07195 [Planctomycetota bacterium]|jgi:hypothetical protein|nr:hypothetical protein [Planctomycetota bacterium]MDP6762133.1 hypothetical protein [Planctomycetota bacterium]MDP6989250.1 hypothetical protein [Planctomycetota bacterium]